MKIIIVNYYGITPDMPGATKHYDMATFFQGKEDTEVEFWLNGINYHTDEPVVDFGNSYCTEVIVPDSGVKLVYFKGLQHKSNRIRRELGSLLFSINTLRRLKKTNADAVILSMPPVTNFIALATKKQSIKLIADVEDLWPLFLKEAGINNKLLLKYYEIQANSVYKNSDAIEAVSEGMLSYVKKVVDCKDKMTWLAPLGVNIESYDSISEVDDLSKYEWSDDYKVMYIGALGYANDLISVVDTICEFNKTGYGVNGKKISFVFIGDGSDRQLLIDHVKEVDQENIFVEKPIKGSLVPYYLSNADVCLTNLRRLECYKLVRPNKLFQYMAAKKPIICGIWGESATIIEESQSGICVDFTNKKSTAAELKQFFDRKGLSTLGENGNKYIRENGSRTIIFEEFYSRISRLIEL